VTGVIDAADVSGPADQGIAAGELTEVIRALRAGAVYANVHTEKYRSGEIRGQVGSKGHKGKNGKGKRDKSPRRQLRRRGRELSRPRRVFWA
jgi:CHRD domain